MYERCLNEAERVLSAQDGGGIPVKSVWESVAGQGRILGFEVPTLGDFTALLEGDRRFELLPAAEGDDSQPDLFASDEEEVGKMEKLAVSPEDRVRLRSAVTPVEDDGEEEITSLRRVQSPRPAKKNAPPPRRPIAKPKKKTTGGPASRRKSPVRRSARTPAPKSPRTAPKRRSTARRGRKK